MFRSFLVKAAYSVVPKSKRTRRYVDQYSCCPPPVFMVLVSLIEVGKRHSVFGSLTELGSATHLFGSSTEVRKRDSVLFHRGQQAHFSASLSDQEREVLLYWESLTS